jgi:hypothetical protein
MSGLNRINIVIPGNSSTAAAQRDNAITDLLTPTGMISVSSFWRYNDLNSGWGIWGYYSYHYGYSSGIATIATVTCKGMAHPPSGSDTVGLADPGPGVLYTWSAVGWPHGLSTPMGSGGGSVPQGNNNYYVWNIPGNSSTAAADFTVAYNAVTAAMPIVASSKLLKYVDSVSGAWQVWFIVFEAGQALYGATSPNTLPNSNILYVVTCHGTPNPPTGSPIPAVTTPLFTQTFTTITAPLSFGPMR